MFIPYSASGQLDRGTGEEREEGGEGEVWKAEQPVELKQVHYSMTPSFCSPPFLPLAPGSRRSGLPTCPAFGEWVSALHLVTLSQGEVLARHTDGIATKEAPIQDREAVSNTLANAVGGPPRAGYDL